MTGRATPAQFAGWLTIPEVCDELQITPEEWDAWREPGDKPLQVMGPDGQPRIRADHLDRWLDSRTLDASDEAPADASSTAGTDAYRVTIEHRDGTAEHHTTARDDAYQLVLDELLNPTPGVSRVDIRPVTGAVCGGHDDQGDDHRGDDE